MTGDGTGEEEFAEAVRQISRDAWQRNRQRAAELSALLATAGSDDLPSQTRTRGMSLAHQLHGSTGTFGYPRAADAADEIERLLRGRAALTAAERRRLADLADIVCSALERRPAGDP